MERVSLVRDSPASDTVSFGVRFQVCCGKAAIQSEIWYFEKHIFLLGHVRTCEDMFTFQFFTIIPCLNSSSEFWTEGRSSPGEKPGGVHRWRMHRGADALHLAEVHSAHPLHRVGDPLSRRAGRVEPGLGDALGKPKKMAKMLLLLTAWFGVVWVFGFSWFFRFSTRSRSPAGSVGAQSVTLVWSWRKLESEDLCWLFRSSMYPPVHPPVHALGCSSCVAGFTWNVETWRFYSCWAFYSCWTGRDRAAIRAFWRPWNGLAQKIFGPMDSNCPC